MRSGASCDSSMGNEQPWEGGRVNGPSRIQDRDLPGPRDCPPGRAVSPSAGIAAAGRRWPRAGPWSQSSSIPALSMVQSYEENISAWLLCPKVSDFKQRLWTKFIRWHRTKPKNTRDVPVLYLTIFTTLGCTFWGKKPSSNKKKLLWQLSTQGPHCRWSSGSRSGSGGWWKIHRRYQT